MRRLATAMLVLSVGCTTAVANEQVLPQGPRPTARHVALAPVVYQLSIDSAAEHLARVEMRISGYSQRPLDVAMPAWSPGAYRLLVPAKNVLQLKATASGQPLVVQQLDRSTWRIHKPPPDGEVVIRYRLYHPRPSVVRSHVARDYAGINGFDTFLYVVGNLGTPCRLSVQPHSDWRVVTGLGVEGALYSTPNYN
ncbi:MAG: putative metalloprotease with PDZ domain, partial [Myxococcota bacterium]